MTSERPEPKHDPARPPGPGPKEEAVPARPGTANKPAGKPANKGPLQKPEKA